ncbi:MAG TPA: choice-of-anchor tandem repeat GloVer-containing protein, partial [Candidatus Acidoferrum sp.]|nr:choice-of-anchor tandem repeat GloVer-containing protein [Candidatus Acidoferrum sp.]
ISSWTWNFGDGTNGTGQMISHTYTNTPKSTNGGSSSNTGTFLVTLTATNLSGTAVQGVGDSNITVSLPTVQFTVTPTNGFVPLSVHFTFPAVDSADNAIVSWKWDFGDGTSFVDRSPDQPVSMNHIYTKIQTFSPKLTVTNVWGTMISSNGPKVGVLPPPIFFTAVPSNGPAPLPVQFGGPGMDSQTNAITNWNWSFGDGATSTAQNPTHIYASAGVFAPALVVTNKKGAGIIAYGPQISAGHAAVHVFGGGGGGYDPSSGGFTNLDGTHPAAGLVIGGNRLYGAMTGGGNGGSGTIFAVNTDGSGFSNLYEFSAIVQMYYTNSDGADPRSRLVLSGDTLYGTATQGGAGFGSGTVFKLNTNGSGFTALHRFTNGADGSMPNGVVVSGNTIYGTTEEGGSAGNGTIFKMNTNDSGITQIHNFAASVWDSVSGNMTNGEGAYPVAAMNLAGDTLYGTASQGGATGGGTVFKLNTNGSGFTVLHGFTNNIDGSSPSGELLFAGGVLYGTTFTGSPAGGGTVFKVNIDGSGFSTLHQFAVASYDPASGNYLNSDGAAPAAGLTLCGATLYGTASKGGSGGGGTIFSIGTNGTGFANLCVFTALVSGTNLDGANPQAGMVLCGDTLYGTAYDGGSNGDGALFTFSLLTAAAPVLFTASPTNGMAPVTVAFAGPGTDGLGAPLTNWNWSFGDGSASAQRNPVYTYVTGGVFAPSLVASNNQGGMVVGFGPQIAVALPTAEFTANPATGGAPLTVQFVCPDLDSSGNRIVSWSWDFGDGSVGTGRNPLHIYTNAGDFLPGLVASNNLGVMVECAGPAAICVVGTCSGLVWNGDFETGDFTAWTSGGMMSYAGVYSAPQFVHSGNYGAMLAGTFGFVATLSQTLATTPGADYLLSFWLNNPAGNSVNQLLVSWDGHTVWGVTNFAAPGWTNVQVAVTGGGTSAALQLTFEASLYFGLDDVSVVLANRPPPCITDIAFCPTVSGMDLALTATGGQLGGTYCVLMSTNLAQPLSQWTPMAVQCLNAGGNFTMTATNAVDPRLPQRFYILRLQ